MSEHQSGQPLKEPSHPEDTRKPDSQLRLVRTDDDLVFPDDALQTDSAPTIISKPKPKSLLTDITAANVPFTGKNLRGQRLAHFELMEPIGVGGMAAVIRARDTQLDRFVALKILPPDTARDLENVRRFHQEARSAAKLDHENIARVFFCGEDRGLYFIAFEFVDGENLRTILERRGQLPVPEAIRIILQVATGLEHAASRNIVHRDIKPSNIIVNAHGRAKLVDMGLARSQLPQGDPGLTQSGVTLGTFDYISPEQALEPREADARSDIYSLGCTLYHMLTGQPPVPEGTAAKKLYHHQHLAPIDPRQLNPSIPDEVAAVLMRMMAKDPKDRYQQPIQLVHHLLQVAEKVGAGADMPEGVMFIDAPLPGPPRFSPLITIALAVLALGALLLLLSLVSRPHGTVTPSPSPPTATKNDPNVSRNGKSVHSDDTPGASVPSTPIPETPPVKRGPVETREQLAEVLRNEKLSDTIVLKKGITLGDGSLRYLGSRKLTIKSARRESPVTLTFTPQVGDAAPGLLVLGTGLSFENIRFVVDPGARPPAEWSEIVIRGPGRAQFVDCEFVGKGMSGEGDSGKPSPVIPGLLLENLGQVPHVDLVECYFQQGQTAVALQGAGDVRAENCAFGPHDVLFHLRDNKNGKATSTLTLDHCSAFVVQGPAFRLDGTHSCLLRVGSCIFSCPDSSTAANNFILQTTAPGPLVKYQGTARNVYHGLNKLWSWPGGPIMKDPDEFHSVPGCKDSDSVRLTVSPWADADPLKHLNEPRRAFQVVGNSADVRTSDDRALGVERCSWGEMTPLRPLAPPPTARTVPTEIVVEPGARDDAEHGLFSSLSRALAALKPGAGKSGQTILVKRGSDLNNPEVPVKLDLDDPQWDLTIKAYPYLEPQDRPILVLGDTSKDAVMLRLIDGRVRFEDVEFLLDPGKLDFKGQTIVALAGNGECSFARCAFTLKQAERRSALSVVSLLERDDVKPAAGSQQPRIVMKSCAVRGEGDLVNVRSSRPVDVNLDSSLFALSGSLLVVQGAGRDENLGPAAPARLRLSHSSAFLTEPCIVLHGGKNAAALVKTLCQPIDGNLFVSLAPKDPRAPEGKPFLVLEGGGIDRESLPKIFQWKGAKNAYVNFPKNGNLLEAYAPGDGKDKLKLDANDWRDQEPDARFLEEVWFTMPLRTRRPLSQMNVDQFKPRTDFVEDIAPFGINLDADNLPRLRFSE